MEIRDSGKSKNSGPRKCSNTLFCGNLYKRVKDPNIVASMSGHKEGSKAFARYRVIDKVAEANAKEIDKDIKRDALKVFEAI